jgi:hypothetical protein
MANSPQQPLIIETLKLTFVDASQLTLSGALNTPTAQTELRRQLAELHERIRKARLQAFSVDVRGLNFVNSSAIRLFVDWISGAESAGYKLVFLIDRSITWHRLSFAVLKSLAPRSIEVVERTPSSATIKARAKLASSSR